MGFIVLIGFNRQKAKKSIYSKFWLFKFFNFLAISGVIKIWGCNFLNLSKFTITLTDFLTILTQNQVTETLLKLNSRLSPNFGWTQNIEIWREKSVFVSKNCCFEVKKYQKARTMAGLGTYRSSPNMFVYDIKTGEKGFLTTSETFPY